MISHSRNLRDHFNNVNCAVLSVGGWYDAEDPLGPFAVYYGTTANNPENDQVRLTQTVTLVLSLLSSPFFSFCRTKTTTAWYALPDRASVPNTLCSSRLQSSLARGRMGSGAVALV